MSLTDADGAWRVVDTMALRAQIGAMAAIVDVRVQSALSREFGVRWVARADGRGHEIEGIAQETLDAFSTRAHTVTRKAASLARQWAQRHGRAPNAREMLFPCDQANQVTRGAKKDEPIDWDALAAKWDATIGGQLAQVANQTCDFDAHPGGAAPPPEVQEQAIAQALAGVQAGHSTWTRANLMRTLSRSMGQPFVHMPPGARQELLEQMTDQAPWARTTVSSAWRRRSGRRCPGR